MKSIIIYDSHHHENTKKLVSKIAEIYAVETADARKNTAINLNEYDLIGFASGIDFGKFYPSVINAAKTLPAEKYVYALYTCGMDNKKYGEEICDIAKSKNCKFLGKYGCKGYDTYGPWKLVGGINKNHPNNAELAETLHFYKAIYAAAMNNINAPDPNIRKCKTNEIRFVKDLFGTWNKSMLTSCLEGSMGSVYVSKNENGFSSAAHINDFLFLAGIPDKRLIEYDYKKDFLIMIPQSEEWSELIENVYKENAVRKVRYALKQDHKLFNPQELSHIMIMLPQQYRLNRINDDLYNKCLNNEWSNALVSSFKNYDDFKHHGLGFVITHGDVIVSGASSYSRCSGSIEIEVDTLSTYCRQGLASAAAAALILECISLGIYPSWDAQNQVSLKLAKKLGYALSGEYTAYEIRK